MYCTEAEMMKNQLPLGYRDYCAHALIPLNRCRVANLYLPWTCQNQKHAYEKCQYEEYVRWTGQGQGRGGTTAGRCAHWRTGPGCDVAS